VRSLDELARKHFLKLSFCAEGPAVAFDRDHVKGGDRLTTPMSYGSQVELLRRDYIRARTAGDKLKVIWRVEEAVQKLRYSPMPDLYPNTLEWEVAIARDRRSPFIVAQIYGVSPVRVGEIKQEIRDKIRAALDKDQSIREVAIKFGVSKSTVGRLSQSKVLSA
jgi:hypothetical protein